MHKEFETPLKDYYYYHATIEEQQGEDHVSADYTGLAVYFSDNLDFANDFTEEFHQSKVRFSLRISESEMKGYFSEPMMEQKGCLEGEDFHGIACLTKETSVPTCIGYAYYEVDLSEDNLNEKNPLVRPMFPRPVATKAPNPQGHSDQHSPEHEPVDPGRRGSDPNSQQCSEKLSRG